MRWRIAATLVSLVALGSCLLREPAGPEGHAVQASILVRADLSGTVIALVVVEVTAPDIATPLVFNIPRVDGVATGTITIPSGSNRTIALRAYDAGGVETHSGSITRDIAPGTNPAISIILAPLTGDVPVTVTLGSFSVIVSPAAATLLLPGDTAHLTATILDANGIPVTGQVTWATLAPTVATVVTTGQQTGRVTAVGGGQATVVAVYGGVAGSTTITVASTPTLVQHVSTPFTRDTIPGMNIYLPNKSLPHNCLIVAVQYGAEVAPGITVSVSDDQGNTYSVGDAITSPYSGGAVPSQARHLAVFYALNARAGVVHITVSFTGGSAWNVSVVASEWYNIALTDALDGASDSATTSPKSTWAAGSITTSVGGDLVYQVAVDEDLARLGSFTAADGFALTSADLMAGTVTQYTVQRAPGVISPTVFVNGADAYTSVAIALKAAAAGTAPGPGIRIVHMYVGNSGQGAATVPLQAPSSGNLLVFTLTRDADVPLTGIGDGNGNSYTEVPGSPITNGLGGTQWMFYAANAVTSSSMTLTLTFASPLPLGSAFIVYDIAGAATSPFDTSNTAMGNQTSDGFNGELTTVSITPAGAGELVIARGDQDAGTIMGLVGPGFIFDNPTWPGQDEQGAGGAAAEFTLDSQAGHYYTLDASPVTFVWVTTRPVAQWETIAAAFKGAGSATGGPPPSSPNPHEPAGFSPIFEKDFSTLPGVGTDLHGVSNIAYDPQNFAIVQDASAPLTPPGTLMTTWPSGEVGGDGPGRWNFWDALPERNGTPYREVYVSFRAKIPTANFENQAVGTKLFYLSHGGDGTYATNDEFLVLYNGDQQKLMSSMQLAYYTAESDDRDTAEVNGGSGVPRYQNVNTTKRFTCGVWNQIELYVNVGTPNNHDGIVRVWIDTVLVTEYTDIKFLDTDYNYTHGVYSGQWTPIWGGVGGTKTRVDFMLIDHFYVSGRP
jgi:hypothetical protein